MQSEVRTSLPRTKLAGRQECECTKRERYKAFSLIMFITPWECKRVCLHPIGNGAVQQHLQNIISIYCKGNSIPLHKALCAAITNKNSTYRRYYPKVYFYALQVAVGILHLADSVLCVSTSVSFNYFYKWNPQVLGGSETAHSAVAMYWFLPQVSHLFLRSKISSAPRVGSGLALAFCVDNFVCPKAVLTFKMKGKSIKNIMLGTVSSTRSNLLGDYPVFFNVENYNNTV